MSLVRSVRARESAQSVVVINVHFKHRLKRFILTGTTPLVKHIQTTRGMPYYPRANGAKRRSGRKPGARVTNSARLFTPG